MSVSSWSGTALHWQGELSSLAALFQQSAQPYVLAVRSNHDLRFVSAQGLLQTDPKTIAQDLDAGAWKPRPAGEGTKGVRLYDRARVAFSGQAVRRIEAKRLQYSERNEAIQPSRRLNVRDCRIFCAVTSFIRPLGSGVRT